MQIDFNKKGHVYFMGIGGISMSGLAQILLSKGFTVSGSDRAPSELTDQLEKEGATIYIGQRSGNISKDYDLCVYTAAIHPDNPEYIRCQELGIPMVTRAEFLGQLMLNFKNAVAISGTHGKTTTSSMAGEMFLDAALDPTLSIGGILPSINGNIRIGSSDYFLTEACEYTNSFLSFNPTTNIILNVKADHLDFFKDLDDIRHSFKLFVEKLPDNVGTLIISSDIEDYEYFFKDKHCHVITFGEDPKKSNYSATNISYDAYGCCSYTLIKEGAEVTTIALSVPGLHNVYNSLAAIAAAENEGIDLDSIKAGLKNFTGTDRRFQKKGEFNGVTVIDDYAHHPDEIKATLDSCKHYPHNTVWCVFQPHTYTRTKSLMDEFAIALSLADKVVLAKIYPARETDNLGISSADLADKIKALGKECYYIDTFEEIEKFLEKNCVNGDLLITMGAGDIVKVGEKLVNNGKN